MNEESIFMEALRQDTPQERIAFLERACAGDVALRRGVDRLLWAHEQAGPFLQGVAGLDQPPELPAREGPGTLIGAYKLLEQIGEGGMGTVFMAEQTQPVQRKVALKIIKAGMDSARVIARFEAERQALALMEHPNIARVLDAGTVGSGQSAVGSQEERHRTLPTANCQLPTDSGRPYFVMELVKGVPVTKYCDERRLAVRERLGLFIEVCHAVQHAHQKGIIHRDLKPSNVLVALYDGKAVPKVIDFGIAKAAGQKLTERTLFTEFGAVVGTLEYMSPEQAELNQLDVDTRSDVYSLGVLLYELLTGTTPLERERLKDVPFLEVLRVIREEEPPTPSNRLSTTQELPGIAANRGLEPKKLSGLVRGELDWIVMKALEKDRNRRYESASALAADVQRYLADEPVQACPPSRWYRFRKFARRNKAVLATAVGLGMALVFTVAVLAFSNVWVTRERDQKDAALTRSRHSLDGALQAVDRMLTRVSENRLAQVPYVEPVRLELLEDALKFCLDFLEDNAGDPAVRLQTAGAYRRVGRIQHLLGQNDQATQMYDRSIELLEELAAEQPGPAVHRRELALTYQGRADLLRHVGKLAPAEQDYEKALRLHKELAAEDPDRAEYRIDLAGCHAGLGKVLEQSAQARKAERAYRDALALWQQLVKEFPGQPENLRGLADSHHFLGELLQNETNRLREAEDHQNRAVTRSEQVLAKDPQDRHYQARAATFCVTQGRLLMDTGRYPQAEKAFRRGIELRERLAKEFPSLLDYQMNLARGYNNLGVVLRRADRLKEAEAAFRQDLAIAKKVVANYPRVPGYQSSLGASLHNLADLLEGQNDLKQAEDLFGQALVHQQAALAVSPKNTEYREFLGNHYASLGYVQRRLKRPEAATTLRRAIEVHKALAGDFPTAPEYQSKVGADLNGFAILLLDRKDYPAARAAYEEAIRYQQNAAKLNPRNPRYQLFLHHHYNGLAFAWVWAGQHAEAEVPRRQAITLAEQLARRFPKQSGYRVQLCDDWRMLGDLQRDVGRPHQAEQMYRKALDIDPKNALAFKQLAWLLSTYPDASIRDPKRAVELAQQAVKLAPKQGACWLALGAAHYRSGQWQEAIEALEKAEEEDPRAETLFFWAMSLWQGGDQDEAREAYDQAVEWIRKNKETLSRDRPRAEDLRRLQSEAEVLLGRKK
jgi:serine/threonine protein kinase/Flp pilus assembly protein TadD